MRPRKAILWCALKKLGGHQRVPCTAVQAAGLAARHTLEKMAYPDLQLYVLFLPVFTDGTLPVGSGRHEGTKVLRDKGKGLMWSTVFVGLVLADSLQDDDTVLNQLEAVLLH